MEPSLGGSPLHAPGSVGSPLHAPGSLGSPLHSTVGSIGSHLTSYDSPLHHHKVNVVLKQGY